MCQWFHIWFLKTRSTPLWEHGLLGNTTLLYGVCIEVGLMMIIGYVPFCQPFFGSGDVTPNTNWAFMLMGGFMLMLINEPRKYYCRAYPKSTFARYFAW